MALWTPYDAEEALDLTRSVRHELASPEYRCEGDTCAGGGGWSRLGPSPPQSPPAASDAEEAADDAEYQAFERAALRALRERSGGSLLCTNPRMRRAVQPGPGPGHDDDSYREQRARNNLAAKQSRDRRKLREMRLALHITFLRNKLAELRARLLDPSCACARCGRPALC